MNTPIEAAVAAPAPCPLCSIPISGQSYRVNQSTICGDCYGKIQTELAAQDIKVSAVPLSIVGGIVGVLIASIVWVVVAVQMHLQIGYIAVLVGFLAGKGTMIGAGKSRGRPLQIVAVACAAGGLLIAKLATFLILIQHGVEAQSGVHLSLVSPELFQVTFENFGSFISPYDLLWAFIAFRVAWRLPARARLVASQ